MSKTASMRIGGGMSFWALGTSLRQALFDRFGNIGLEKFTPDPKTPPACLRHGLAQAFEPRSKDETILVRPTSKTNRFLVVAEIHDEDNDNDYDKLCRAEVRLDNQEVSLLPLGGFHITTKVEEAVHEHYSAARATVSAASLAHKLTEMIESGYGLCLRPNGGIYWLNADKLERWHLVEQAVEASATEGSTNDMYCLTCLADEHMVKAVGDKLTEEIKSAVEEIEEEVTSGELKVRGCEARQARAERLLAKVARYEGVFAQPLEDLRRHLERAQTTAAMAALKAAAAAVAEAA